MERQLAAALESRAPDIGAIGMSAAVSPGGGPAAFAAWGLDGRNPDVAMKPTGRFRIGSVTKTFTSALVLDLAGRGRLALHDTIEQWLPSYPHCERISIESLLTHTSGTADMTADAFPDYIALLLADLSRRFTPEEFIAANAALAPFAAPGTSYRYSNTDYLILGSIAERVAGAPFAELLTRRFAAPLELRETAYEDTVPDDLVHGWFDLDSYSAPGATPTHDLDTRDFPNGALVTTAYAAGGMTSSLIDLLSWGAALYLGAALSESMRARLLASPSVEDPETRRWHGYGVVGYGARSADGSWPAYGHGGNIPGSSAFVATFPGSRTTVVMHANVQEVPTEIFIDLAFEVAGERAL